MERTLRVLVVEDVPDDAELMIFALRKAGLEPTWQRIETADELRAALAAELWDAVLSDYTLPGFSATAALELVRATDPDLPFIVVSGSIGEDVAVELLRAGANDYVLKQSLARLAPAVSREVREAENRRSKRAAERMSSHLAAIVEASVDAIVSETIDGQLTSWNRGAERLYGWTAAEAIGRHVSVLVPPDKSVERASIMARVRAGENVGGLETVRLHKDGHRIDISWTISPMRLADGQLIGFTKIGQDIRERKRAERQLGRTANLLNAVVEGTTDAVFVKDREGRYLLVNEAASKFVGRSVMEVLGNDDTSLFNPSDSARIMAHARHIMQVGHAETTEEVLTAAGMTRTYLATLAPYRDGLGNVIGVVGIARDITKRRRSEEALRLSEVRYRRLFEAALDGILMVDPTSRQVIDVNPFLANMLGYTRDELVGKELWELGLFKDIEANKQAFQKLQETGSVRYDDLPLKTKDGRGIEVEFVSNVYDVGDTQVIQCNIRDVSQQKRADKALRLSEERYRSLIVATSAIVWDSPPSGAFDSDQPAWTAFTGQTLEQHRGWGWLNALHPEDRNKSAQAWAAALAKRGEYRIEHRVRRADGQYRRMSARAVPLFHSDGAIREWVGVHTDVTEQSRLASERTELLAQLTLQIERMPLAYLLSGSDGRYTRWNPAAERMFGFTEAEVLGHLPSERIVPPQSVAMVVEIFRRLAAGDMNAHGTCENITKAGRTIECEWHNTPLFDAEGVFQGVLSLAQNVTARRLADKTLHLQDRAIRAVTQGILITDPGQSDNPIIFVSPGFEQMTGYSSEEALGRNCRFLQGKDTDAVAVSRVREAIQIGQPCTIELLNYRKDGATFWNELSISPVRDATGLLTHFVGVQADVTERKKLEDQYRQAQKMEAFGQLAGGVAHDFNNLLTVINGYSDILLDDLPSTDPRWESVGEIRGAGERAAGLTAQLLAFSRKTIVEPKILDLNALVEQVGKLLRRLIGEDITLITELLPSLSRVKADQGQIEQVIMNLAVNARDAMPKGGWLTIATKNVEILPGDVSVPADQPRRRHVQISVSDTGAGMTDEVKAKIFEPFYTTKAIGKGTGLGLATVYGIVKQANGQIVVTSVVGVGTTFSVLLPAVLESVSQPEVIVSDPPTRGTETVLLVEDEFAVRKFARLALQSQGYKILEAHNGAEAIRITEEHDGPIQLLLTDVVMLGGGGRDLAEAIRTLRLGVRVLFMSGYTDDEIVRNGVVEAKDAFLQKPFTPLALARKVRAVLDEKKDRTGS